MAERKKAPPDSSPPFNMEDVEVIRKKSAPAGPPPPRMISFKAPKMSKADSKSRNDEEDDSEFKRERSRSRSSSPDRPVSPEPNTPEHRFKNNRPNIRRDRSESTDSGERRERLRRDRNDDDDDRSYRGRDRSRSNSSERRYRSRDARSRSSSRSRDRRNRNDDDNRRSRSSERGRYRDRDNRSRSRSSSRDRRGRNSRRREKSPISDEGRKRGGSFVSLPGSDEEENAANISPGKNALVKGASAIPLKAESKQISSLKPETGAKESILSFTELMKSTYRELRNFVMNPPPARTLVKCYIERNKAASTFLSPVYSLCADLDDGTGRELITCRKIMGRSAHYVFSLKNDDLFRTREKRSKLYLGKLRSISANEYVLYDNGACAMPDGKGDDILNAADPDIEASEADENGDDNDGDVSAKNGAADTPSLYRSQLVVISFNSKKRPCSGLERGMEVCIPHPLLAAAAAAEASSSSSAADPSQKKLLVDIVKPFKTMREEGTQNDKYRNKLVVFHERNSKYNHNCFKTLLKHVIFYFLFY